MSTLSATPPRATPGEVGACPDSRPPRNRGASTRRGKFAQKLTAPLRRLHFLIAISVALRRLAERLPWRTSGSLDYGALRLGGSGGRCTSDPCSGSATVSPR